MSPNLNTCTSNCVTACQIAQGRVSMLLSTLGRLEYCYVVGHSIYDYLHPSNINEIVHLYVINIQECVLEIFNINLDIRNKCCGQRLSSVSISILLRLLVRLYIDFFPEMERLHSGRHSKRSERSIFCKSRSFSQYRTTSREFRIPTRELLFSPQSSKNTLYEYMLKC